MFLSLNVLIAINGTSELSDGVLFSAHFDSVSTAGGERTSFKPISSLRCEVLGATDDGMGVVTLLQLAQHFAKHPPRRNAVFNINNGEEDWLNGAHVWAIYPILLKGPRIHRSFQLLGTSALSHGAHVPQLRRCGLRRVSLRLCILLRLSSLHLASELDALFCFELRA